jgi:RNA polymerase sigma factor (sigma-70 family)
MQKPTPNDLVELEEYIRGGCRKWAQSMPTTPLYSFEDLVQEAFVYMLDRLPHYDPKLSKLNTFIWNSLRNHFRFLRTKATREHKTFVHLPDNQFDMLMPEDVAEDILDNSQVKTIEERDLLAQVQKKLNKEEDFVFQCFMNPPADLWKMARERREKNDKKRKRKTLAINPRHNDVSRYLTGIGGCTWTRKVIKSLRKKVQEVLAAS